MASVIRKFRDRNLPENYFRVEVEILRALGIELLREETLFYRIYSRITLFVLVYSFTMGEAYELYSQWGDLNAVVNVLNYLITHVTGAIKVTLLFFNRKKIGRIIKMLHNVPFKPNELRGGDVEKYYIRNIIRTTEIQLVVYFTVVSVTVNSGALVFLKSRIFDPKDEWQYPFVPITIVNTTYSPTFEIACVYQVTCVLLYAAIIATIYVLLSTIMAHLSVQLKILQNAFRNISNRAEAMRKADHERHEKNRYVKIVMGEYIDHHLKVFQLADEMEELCNLMILVVFLASVILLCFLLYQSSRFPLGSVYFVQNFFYYWIIVCQVGMYCYWGNEVGLQSEGVAKAATEVDWPGAPLQVSKALVLVIARSQRPLYMTAGKFVPLSLATFMSILKGSFSYFMVLRQTQESFEDLQQ